MRRSVFDRETLGSASAAAALTMLLVWLGPPGTDLAAHVYQLDLFAHHGFVLWNNLWYAGRYDYVTYSLLYYPLAALLGIRLLAVASVAIAAAAFAVLCRRQWGRPGRRSSRVFSVVWPGIVLTAAFPFALGVALALLALCALGERRSWSFAVLSALALAASPLAFLLLAIVVAGLGLARRHHTAGRWLPAALTIAACGATELLLRRAFSEQGRFPYPPLDAAAVSAFALLGAALTWRVERARQLHWIFVVYLAGSVVAYLVPSGLGGNVDRIRFAAIPIAVLALSLRRWRPLSVCLLTLALAASWNLAPLARALEHAPDPSARATYWRPAIRFLHGHLDGSYRVEAVDTAGHWAAVYLPEAGIPIARGWFRQSDFPENRLLYHRLRPPAYRLWLHRLGVRYVVLTNAPTDYSARREAALLRSGRSGLRQVMRTRNLAIYAVPTPMPILSGPAPARVLTLGQTSVRVWVARPGRYRLAIRYSPYLRAEGACLTTAPGQMTTIHARHRGSLRIVFDVDAGSAASALLRNAGQHGCDS